jgi:hypothetical protein
MMKPIGLTHRAGNTEVFSLVVIGSDEGENSLYKAVVKRNSNSGHFLSMSYDYSMLHNYKLQPTRCHFS